MKPAAHLAAPGRQADRLPTTIGDEAVELFADRALLWTRMRTLFVADVHLGKAAAFRAGGVPVPRGSTAADLARLAALVDASGAQRLVVLGDFLHAKAGVVPALDAAFLAWRDAHPSLAITLVRGNHDANAGDPPERWGVDVVGEPHALPPFLACHAPASPRTGYALCGHVHPGVRLSGRGDETVRLPCFVLGRRRAILPAFGRMTGLAIVAPAPDETIVAIAGRDLFRLPG
jgi:DNA ligase-associated metallophosphoesterase